MRKERLYCEVNLAFQEFLDGEGTYRFHKLYKHLQQLYSDMLLKDNDYRDGESTFGYDEVSETLAILANNWQKAYKVKWLLDGIEKEKI